MDKLEQLKNKLSKVVRNRPTNSWFTEISHSDENHSGYSIEERLSIYRYKNNASTKYEIKFNGFTLMSAERKRINKLIIFKTTQVTGEYTYLDMLYKRIEAHNKKLLEDKMFNNIDTFLNS